MRACLLVPVLALGCGYPTFGFDGGEDASLIDPGDRGDTTPDPTEATVEDTRVDDAIDAQGEVPTSPLDADGEAAPVPDALDCAAPKVLCDGLCIEPRDDPRACGGCGRPACAAGSTCVSGSCQAPTSCSEIRTQFPDLPSGAYQLASGLARCEMREDGGGWTLVMKIDGAKSTFAYESSLWTDDAVVNASAVELDRTEHKHAAFARLAFSSIRLGVVDGDVTRTAVLSQSGTSLRALFSGGRVRTSLGRAKWLSLLASPSLQPNCNDEGVNVEHRAGDLRLRLGIAGNEQNDCGSPDSFIGFGATVFACSEQTGITLGNYAVCAANPTRRTRAFGQIWIR
jgi:hypothetical protein